ncbi:MAG: hypothetical protein R2755_27665 [Acidimicrobiales bacterium]
MAIGLKANFDYYNANGGFTDSEGKTQDHPHHDDGLGLRPAPSRWWTSSSMRSRCPACSPSAPAVR